ncbi:MAG: PilT/PilU family type 4a pilus ATPase [Candidatus Peregrinibacteria bacterium]
MASNPNDVFRDARRAGASDVHLVFGKPLLFRIDGALVSQGKEKCTDTSLEHFIHALLSAEEFARLKREREIDCSYALKSGVRLRINCHFERGHLGLAARVIPDQIPSLSSIGFVQEMTDLCMLQSGLVLFTGPTGAGKSTSMAAMIQHINAERAVSIVTLEDPVEFIFPEGKSIIRQRQFGEDFLSFAEALRRVLRQDPNIVMVGEMRDLETIAAALTLAETGHLIFATLHTPNAVQAVNRIIDVFPPHQQQQIRFQLSLSLRAIIAQRLLPLEGGRRVALRELLINTPAVAHIIRDNRLQELSSVLQVGRGSGMFTFEQDSKRLLKGGRISKETALRAFQD